MKQAPSTRSLPVSPASQIAIAGTAGFFLAASAEMDAGIQHITLNFSFDRPAPTAGGSIPYFNNNTTTPLLVNGTSLQGFARIGMAGQRNIGSGTSGFFAVYFDIVNPATSVKRVATTGSTNALWDQLPANVSVGTATPKANFTFEPNFMASVISQSGAQTAQAGTVWAAPTNAGEPVPGTVSGFLGWQFGAGATAFNAWARIDLYFDGGGTPTGYDLIEIALSEIGGQALLTGQTEAIPEPAHVATGLGLLALGAAGLRERRKRRQDQARADQKQTAS